MASREDIVRFIAEEFPQTRCTIEEVGSGRATLVRRITQNDLRPGGTVSGPVLMAVADEALYVALLGQIGIVPLAVTTSLTINFLRKPAADRDLIGRASFIKIGKSLAVGEVSLYSRGIEHPVAHVVGTYSIPPTDR